MNIIFRFAVLLGPVLFLNAGSKADIFDNVLDLVVPKKYVQVKDLYMKTCSNGHEGLELQNIHVFNNREEEIVISGKVNIMTFLSAPITAKVSMERQVLGVWVNVPCIRDFGSCIYEDLCNYGYDEDTTCPASFVQDRVPCRCPIEKGLYKIPSDVRISAAGTRWMGLISGKYRATVKFTHSKSEMACYTASFTLKAVPK